jgi:prevent-host-death family protein
MAAQKSMPAVVSATQVQRKFGEIVRQVNRGSVHFIVEREGLPVMAIISMAEYQEFLREREQHEKDRDERLQRFREAARQVGEKIEELGLTEEELDAQIEAARKEYYSKKRHGNRSKQSE